LESHNNTGEKGEGRGRDTGARNYLKETDEEEKSRRGVKKRL
jgi:hypothetical protein